MILQTPFHSCRQQGRRGFTLMEVLFAAMAFALIVLVMKTTFYGALRMRDQAETRMDQMLVRRQAIRVLENDLNNLTYTSNLFASAIRCENMGTPDDPQDRFEFYSTSGVIQEGLYNGDLQKITYQLAEPLIQTNGTARVMDLVRTIEGNPLVSTAQALVYQRLLSNISSLDFLFYDGENWNDDWDTSLQDPPIPSAIRVAVQFHREDDQQPLRSNELLDLVVPIQVQTPLVVTEETGDEAEGENDEDNDNNGGDNSGGNGGGGGGPGGNNNNQNAGGNNRGGAR